MSDFEYYLDGSDDAATIELEIGSLPCFERLWGDAQWNDAEAGFTDEDIYTSSRDLFSLIREVWDIAYSYGEHDALIGEGVSLSEIVESE